MLDGGSKSPTLGLYFIELETTEAIKLGMTLCAHSIWDVETHWTMLISEPEV